MNEDAVRQALVEFIGKHISVCFVGVVSDNSKAESEGFVTVRYNDLPFDVRVQAVTNKTDLGIVPVPAEGSEIFCVSEGNSENSFVAVAFTKLDKIKCDSGIKIEGLNENLFTVLSDFITEVAKIIVVQGTSPNVAALTQIKQRLNKILK